MCEVQEQTARGAALETSLVLGACWWGLQPACGQEERGLQSQTHQTDRESVISERCFLAQ